MLYTRSAVILGMVAFFVPLFFFVMVQGLAKLPPNALISARLFGLTFDETVIFVLVPALQRSILISITLVFGLSLGFYATPRMLGGGNTLFVSNIILGYFTEFGDEQTGSIIASWLALLGIIITIWFVFLELWWRPQRG
jgi:ABC-type spermidine/putrescine transport system permease subunit I